MVKVEGDLNDPTSLSQLECGSIPTLSPENSFVVVEHESMRTGDNFASVIHHENSPPNQNVSNDPKLLESGVKSQSPLSILSSSYVEPKDIQDKLDLVLQENMELKETLHQNNLAMRQQMETLQLWQNEVEKVQHGHSEKFQQTKGLVIKLKSENSELRRQLEKLQNCINNTGDGSPKSNSNTPSRDRSDREPQQANNISDSQSSESDGTGSQEKNFLTESETKQLLLANDELLKMKQKLEVHCERVAAENVSLRKQFDRIRFQEGKMEELNTLVQQLTHKLETSERGRRQLEFDLEKAKYSHTDKNLLELGNENCALRTTLVERNKEIENLRKKLGEIYFAKSEREENGQNRNEEINRGPMLERNPANEILLRQLEEAQLSIVERDSRISDLMRQVEEFHGKFHDLETKLEAVPILQAQVEVYQADFHAEREARQQAVSEKENLERILKSTDIRLRSLNDAQNNLGGDRNGSQNRPPRHICPICSAGFSDMTALETHVDACLA